MTIEMNEGARRANDLMHQQRLEDKLDQIINRASPVDVEILRSDLSTAKQLIDELMAECNLSKTQRGQRLLARVNIFLHGERPSS